MRDVSVFGSEAGSTFERYWMQQIGVSVLLVRERAKVGSAAQREGRLAEACSGRERPGAEWCGLMTAY